LFFAIFSKERGIIYVIINNKNMNRVVHFEIPAENPEKVSKFYTDVFGWKIKQWNDQPYWLVETGPKGEMGIDGGIYKKDWMDLTVNTIGVQDLAKAMETVKNAGGEIVREPMDIPGAGRQVYGKDPEGNMFGMLQPSPEMKNM
jgi:predicted enzyme related to lactoylglutathione lyase